MDLRIFDPLTALFSRTAKKRIKFEEINHAVKKKIPGYSDMERQQAILDTQHHLESQEKCKLPGQSKTGWNPLTALCRTITFWQERPHLFSVCPAGLKVVSDGQVSRRFSLLISSRPWVFLWFSIYRWTYRARYRLKTGRI